MLIAFDDSVGRQGHIDLRKVLPGDAVLVVAPISVDGRTVDERTVGSVASVDVNSGTLELHANGAFDRPEGRELAPVTIPVQEDNIDRVRLLLDATDPRLEGWGKFPPDDPND